MTIAGALATLLDVVARDSEARCARMLADARTQAEALGAEAANEGRQRLRAALRAARTEATARVAAAQARLEAGQRRAAQGRAGLALAAAGARLPEALGALWANPARRRRWLEQALARAAQSLPRDAWRIRHAPGLDEADRAFLRQRLDELGVGDADVEADASIDAGLEVRAGAARLEATLEGLLADRAWVHGRLLHLMETS